VEISSGEGGPDKMTLWVAKNPCQTVKYEASMPEMGGATMTAELLPP
jgi:hypothetical protein